jgi:aspartate/methionine/tyrosine aminotransferase
MSKPYGLPGTRIGWVATPDKKVIDAATHIKHYTTITPNTTGEILALIALKAQAEILGRQRETMLANRALMMNFFEAYPELFCWRAPKGGCLAFPELLTGESIDNFAERLLDETGLFILSGSLYHWPGNYFRISYAQRNLPEALARFEQFCTRP